MQPTTPSTLSPFWVVRKAARYLPLIVGTAAAAVLLGLAACRTTAGLGQDVEHLGKNVSDSAEKHTP